MNLKGQLSHNLEVGSDPLGNVSRINHELESMLKQLLEAQTKLETVEHQLETAKVEVTKPFAQEAELCREVRASVSIEMHCLTWMKKGNDGIDMDDEPEAQRAKKRLQTVRQKNTRLAQRKQWV